MFCRTVHARQLTAAIKLEICVSSIKEGTQTVITAASIQTVLKKLVKQSSRLDYERKLAAVECDRLDGAGFNHF